MKQSSLYDSDHRKKFSSFGAMSLKEACQRKAGTDIKRKEANRQATKFCEKCF